MIVIWNWYLSESEFCQETALHKWPELLHISIHSEEVLPSIHADKYYPCELVGTWNTWYGEQDQAGRMM